MKRTEIDEKLARLEQRWCDTRNTAELAELNKQIERLVMMESDEEREESSRK